MTFQPVFYLLILLTFLSPITATAQDTEYTLTGKVTTTSGEPLAGVNVYISNTLEGASTDSSGFFKFTTSLKGKFQLVASFIGFHSSEQIVYLLDEPVIEINFKLEESVFNLEELVVQGEFDKEWNRYLREFKTFFIGNDDFARQTTILNPAVLEFEWLESQKKLQVINKAPLKIRNDALGYFIEVELQNVIFEPATNTGYYIVKSRYEELETESRSTRRTWARNRQIAYKGSSRHFFYSLITDRLRRNKFEIFPNSSAIERIEDDAQLRKYYPGNWQFMKENYTSFYITTPQLSIGHDLDKDRGGGVFKIRGTSVSFTHWTEPTSYPSIFWVYYISQRMFSIKVSGAGIVSPKVSPSITRFVKFCASFLINITIQVLHFVHSVC